MPRFLPFGPDPPVRELLETSDELEDIVEGPRIGVLRCANMARMKQSSSSEPDGEVLVWSIHFAVLTATSARLFKWV